MIHVAFVAPFFSENMRHCLACFADIPGVQLGVITQEHENRLPPDVRECVSAHYRIDDTGNADQIAEGARGIKQQLGGLDQLESYLEMLQVPVAEARDALGLHGISGTVARNFRDKNLMKDVLRRAGVPVARQALVHDAEDARRFVAEVGFPIVLKPLAGLGARDTMRATDDASMSSALNALLPSRDNPVQAEEFVRGEEHSFESATVDGKSVWSSSVRYLPSPLQVIENAWMQYCLVMPREIHEPHVKEFAPVNAQALDALGLENGISHMEWFLREDNTPVVSEVGARPPGANIMPMLHAAHGADPWAAWARLVVNKSWEFPSREFAAGCVFLRAKGGGAAVQQVEGVEAMKKDLGSRIFDYRLPSPGQPRSTHYEGDGWVIVRHAETSEVVESMRAILSRVQIV
jgi:biotin carboxylase